MGVNLCHNDRESSFIKHFHHDGIVMGYIWKCQPKNLTESFTICNMLVLELEQILNGEDKVLFEAFDESQTFFIAGAGQVRSSQQKQTYV